MHHKYIQVLQPQHANTQYSCRDKRRRDKQQYSSARSIPSRRRGKQKAMAGRSSRRAAPPCRHPGSAGSTAGTPSLASPFQVRTRQRILVAPARRLQFLDSPLFATARSGRKKRRRRTEQIRPLAIKKGGVGHNSLLRINADFPSPSSRVAGKQLPIKRSVAEAPTAATAASAAAQVTWCYCRCSNLLNK